jgi:endonuclease/exonuclease/phosphatase family metal-dependent hydrolase
VKFDYILTKKSSVGTAFMAQPIVVEQSGFSDHLPVIVDIKID